MEKWGWRVLLWMAAVGLCGCAVQAEIAPPEAEGPGDRAPFVPATPSDPACAADFDPGRVALRRLNNFDYGNTVSDLLGEDLALSARFPADGTERGFDTVAAALSTSPLHAERYEAAAETLASALVGRAREPASARDEAGPVQRFEAEALGGSVGQIEQGSAWNLWSNGEIAVDVETPAGLHRFAASAYGTRAGNELPRLELRIDGQLVRGFEVEARDGVFGEFAADTTLSAGRHRLTVVFTNDLQDPGAADPRERDRNLIVDQLSLTPLGSAGPAAPTPEPRGLTITCMPSGDAETLACAREVLAPLVRRAYRRPVSPAELDRLLAVFSAALSEGEDLRGGLRWALRAVFLSPHFLFRVELDPPEATGRPYLLSDHELATRLAYFLSGSAPDAELARRADAGALRDPKTYAQEVDRLLASPRRSVALDDFGAQWLGIRKIRGAEPSPDVFPEFDEALREALTAESEQLFAAFATEDRNFLDLVDAPFSFINERLGRHYGLAGISGEALQRVDLTGQPRGGLLTLGSLLLATSTPIRTSPVRRGAWILDRLLCSPPAPPPPNVGVIAEEPGPENLTVRERLAQHRENPACAVCHDQIDPLGFGLEQFDGIGKFRTEEGPGAPIDASGTLPGGTSFDDARGLAAGLKADPRVSSCVVEHVFTYAVGRVPRSSDACVLASVQRQFATSDYRFSALLRAIALSDPFRARRAE